ncbi:MAG: DUF805 domain-containing protein, partial [Anaerolineales bacterium]|nr:DUF805 domain-containing protein [Anaerolineales bacterium]
MKLDSELVKKLRTAKSWSQEQLGEASGLSPRTIQRLENGGNASMESVRALAAAFEVDSQELLHPEKDAHTTPLDAVRTGFLQFANFSDTATRFEYWWFFLFILLVMAVAAILHEKVLQVVSVIVLLPFLAAGTRRLHDTGRSGWWQLLWFAPFAQIPLLFLLAEESRVGQDKKA